MAAVLTVNAQVRPGRRYIFQTGSPALGPRASVTVEPDGKLGFFVTDATGRDGLLVTVRVDGPCYLICELHPLGSGRWKVSIDRNGEYVESDPFDGDMGGDFEPETIIGADLSGGNNAAVSIAEIAHAVGPVPEGERSSLGAYYRQTYGVGG